VSIFKQRRGIAVLDTRQPETRSPIAHLGLKAHTFGHLSRFVSVFLALIVSQMASLRDAPVVYSHHA
jgi:hypothetical protein